MTHAITWPDVAMAALVVFGFLGALYLMWREP